MQENSKSEHDAERKPAPLRGGIGHVGRPDAYLVPENPRVPADHRPRGIFGTDCLDPLDIGRRLAEPVVVVEMADRVVSLVGVNHVRDSR